MFTKECPVCGGVVSHKVAANLKQIKTCSHTCGVKHRPKPIRLTLQERVERGFTPGEPDACWLWSRYRNACGYGVLGVGGKATALAHRSCYAVYVSEIPEGVQVLHTCDTPACVNPAHLFLGTHQDNMADMYRKGRGNKVRGVKHRSAKLSEEDVYKIRERLATGRETLTEISKDFNVGFSAISCIKTGRTWRHTQ